MNAPMVTLRRCEAADVADVLTFLDCHWKAGHIFITERSLFEWQHALHDRPGEYSIAIARRNSDNVLLGVLGYLPTRQFDPALGGDNTIWLALWKVRDDLEVAGLGLRLVKYVADNEPHTTMGVIGFNESVRPIYQALGFAVGELEHYVIPNPDMTHFELASLPSSARRGVADGGLTAIQIDDQTFSQLAAGIDLGQRNEQAPRKTPLYFAARYLRHPIYRYTCFVVRRGGASIGLLATRVATHRERRAVRVVDYIGPPEAICGLGALLLPHVRATGAEYADVYNWGIEPELFERGGFSRIDPDGPDIVPDHFEPFERRNVRLRFALKTRRPAVVYKGDSDQDRPNRLPVS